MEKIVKTRTFDLSQVKLNNTLTQVGLGITMLFAASQIYIPIQPVPITMQTVGVMLIALSLPYKAAMGSILGYLGLAALGVPVLAQFSGGFASLTGATAGYLVGFVYATHVMSRLRERFTSTSWNVAAICIIGQLCIYACGVAWLSRYFDSTQTALHFGFYPFILPGLVKASILALATKHLIRK